jgi:hypothetical protein
VYVLELNWFLSWLMLSSSLPSSLETLEVVHEWAVMIGLPVSMLRLWGEAVDVSLWTSGRSFMYGICMSSRLTGFNSLRLSGAMWSLKRNLSLYKSLLLSVMCCSMLKLSTSVHVCVVKVSFVFVGKPCSRNKCPSHVFACFCYNVRVVF